jgi:hypothetical protein
MRTIFLAASLMIGMTSVAQKGMNDYASVDVKPSGDAKVFVTTFGTYIYNVEFIEDANIYDIEIEGVLAEYYRILEENDVKFKVRSMDELFDMINTNGFIYIKHIKDGIEYIVTIQDTSGEIIVITEQ